MTEPFDELLCKAYDVFAGDFGSPSDRLLQDSIVMAAKAHKKCCHMCGGCIAKGERHRVRTEIVDGDLQSYRKTKDGFPRHPLYVRADQPLIPFYLMKYPYECAP